MTSLLLIAVLGAAPLDLTPYFAEQTPLGRAHELASQGNGAGAHEALREVLAGEFPCPAPADEAGRCEDTRGQRQRRLASVAFATTLTKDPGERLRYLRELEPVAEWAAFALPDLARDAEGRGDVEAAIALYARVPLAAPVGVDSRLAAARLLARRKRVGEALALLDAAGARGRVARVDLLERCGRRGEAVVELTALWEEASTDEQESDLATRLGRLGARPADSDRLAKLLALDVDPKAARRRFKKVGRAAALADGLVHLDADRSGKALPLLVKAATCATAYCRGVALGRLAQARLASGDRAGALASYAELATELPDHPEAPTALARAMDLARVLGESGRLEALNRQATRANSPEQEWAAAFSAYRGGDAAAAQRFRRLAVRHGRTAHLGGTTWGDRASYWEARSLERSGALQDAAERYTEVAGRNPLTWYSHLAWDRLAELDAARAAEVRPHRALERLDPPALGELGALGLESGPDVRLAAALFRAGLHDAARKDLDARGRAGTLGPGGVAFLLALRVRLAREDPALAAVRWGGALPRQPDGPDERLWRLMYPLVWWSVATAVATHEAVDPFLALAVVRHESRYNPKARSKAGAYGLMQLLVPTAKELARGATNVRGAELPEAGITAKSLRRPEVNLRLGIRYLRSLGRMYEGNTAVTLAAYNAGPGRVRRWLREASAQGITETDEWVETLPFRQAHAYVKAVAGSWGAYRYIYGPREDQTMRSIPLPGVLPR